MPMADANIYITLRVDEVAEAFTKLAATIGVSADAFGNFAAAFGSDDVRMSFETVSERHTASTSDVAVYAEPLRAIRLR